MEHAVVACAERSQGVATVNGGWQPKGHLHFELSNLQRRVKIAKLIDKPIELVLQVLPVRGSGVWGEFAAQ